MELSSLEIWVILGVIFLLIEIFSVSFFAIFFGIGGLATALLTYLELTNDLVTQIIAFLLVSVGTLLVFRKQILAAFSKNSENYTELVNEKANVSADIPAKGEGKVFYRGSDWIAESVTDIAIPKGATVLIKKVDGIRLIVEVQ
ncbi:NfeD family protein [Arcticibacterium luteifluviistationis]|uniref:NfeD family protein n=1 Tax=Arcticibacterium luteifluviistationis TaxID=1784714 RepID=A0A2Z4GD44_9BACT|nr:NfeD family protein [Arcticibacterium luteifluviistationis]AWV99008.1 NfeD family protein [Arcticibacterium luteifluviistationis]